MLRSRAFSILQVSINNLGVKSFVGSGCGIKTRRDYSTIGEAIQRLKFKYIYDIRHHLDNDKWAKIFAIEGNIGVGKNKFGEEFSKLLDLKFFPTTTIDYCITRLQGKYPDEYIEYMLSPDSSHKHMYNFSMDYFSRNPTDWVHTSRLQLFMLQNRHHQYCDAFSYLLRTGRGVVTNRTFFTDRVFADAQRKMKWLNNEVYDYYDCLFINANEEILHPQVVIYLDIPAEQCYENVQAGDCEVDKRLPLEFFQRLEQAYKEKYFPFAKERGVNIIELDWTKPLPVDEIVEKIDEIEQLEAAHSSWPLKINRQFKRMMKSCDDEDFRDTRFNLFTPIDELWVDREHIQASDEELNHSPFHRPIGLNPKLGDKNIFLKEY